MNEILKDKRFAHIPRDPAFKRIPRTEKKVKIDKRFQSMFSDKKFKVKYTVDKRGKPIRESSSDNLRKYYALESSEESEDTCDEDEVETSKKKENEVQVTPEKNKKVSEKHVNGRVSSVKSAEAKELKRRNARNSESHDYSISSFQRHAERTLKEFEGSGDNSNDSSQDEDNDELDLEPPNLDTKIRGRLEDLTVDYARGEGRLLSDSSSDEETTEEEDEDDVDHGWGELDQDAERTDDSTRRLAVCNMDWDRIRAQDLMVLLNSFLPKGGVIHSVTVYPSEFGLQRLKEEEEKGPLELRGEGDTVVVDSDFEGDEKRKKKARDEDEIEEGSHYQREKLRQYQLNRLRYYYAVVVCDSVATADALYKECDGMEYESSASHLDLRFIPDDTTFDQEPRETCSNLPEMKKYEPQLFITTALQQSKVRLTWDETDPQRLKFNEKINSGKVEDVDENDLKVYIATSSSEEEPSDTEDPKETSASKYKALLQTLESKEEEKRQKNMEMEVTWGIDLKQKVEKRLKDGKPNELTPFQKYVQKRKEKKKAKREEQLKKKQQFRENAGENGEDNVSNDNDVPSDIDMDDAYFKEEFETEEFAHSKKSESKNKKNKKKKDGDEVEDEETKRKKAELELLLMDDDDNKKHFSLRDILIDDKKNKKKKKKIKEEINEKKVDDFEVNVQDNRFAAIFTSHLYNIDPADPHYKKTKGMETLRQEKLNRRVCEEIPAKKPKVETLDEKKDPELSLLVKNVKRKAQILSK